MPRTSSSLDELLRTGVLKKGDDPSLAVKRTPIGIPIFDNFLGGGLPRGRAIISYGPESTGKTLISQYAVAAVQRSEYPLALYMDMERSYDEAWWQQSGVDTEKLLVSSPATAQEAIDVIVAMLRSCDDLGIIILDSIAAMTPAPEMDEEKSAEDNKQPGLQAKATTLMYRKIFPLLGDRVIFLATNQMRENIGAYDELGALPGGRAQRHYSHIILRTRRQDWINDNNTKQHIGFYMEITSRKNKVANTPDGSSIILPFMFDGQIDMMTTHIQDAITARIITKRGPYYYLNDQNYLGMSNLRQFLTDNPEEFLAIQERMVPA